METGQTWGSSHVSALSHWGEDAEDGGGQVGSISDQCGGGGGGGGTEEKEWKEKRQDSEEEQVVEG